jgi:hypothetical protein
MVTVTFLLGTTSSYRPHGNSVLPVLRLAAKAYGFHTTETVKKSSSAGMEVLRTLTANSTPIIVRKRGSFQSGRSPEGKRPLGRSRRRGWTVLKWILREVGWDCMDWIDVAQDKDQWKAIVNTVKKLHVPKDAGKFLKGCTIGGFSRRAQFRE